MVTLVGTVSNSEYTPESPYVVTHMGVFTDSNCSQAFLLEDVVMESYNEEAPLCACGCGKPVTMATRYCDLGKWNKYISGHSALSRRRREENIRRLAEKQPLCACGCGERVRRNPRTLRWNTYIIGHGMRGKKVKRRKTEALQQALQNLIKRNKEKVWTDEERKNISDKLKGRELSEETKRRMSAAKLGVPKSEETKIRMSICKMSCRTGEGGYCDQWFDPIYKNDLRKSACENCGITNMLQLKLFGVGLTDHHIDFDKMNCHPSNIQTVCSRCHRIIHIKHNQKLKGESK